MSVYFLTSNDFEAKSGKFLYKNAKPELTLILFYSTNCPHCKPILPLFQQLSLRLRGCKYALMNVGENYSAAVASRQTSTPINYVPLVVLYYNGLPIKQYSSQYTFENLKNFLMAAAKEMHSSKSQDTEQTKETPAFTTGTPYCDEESGVCYLSFDKAYSAKS